LDHKVYNLRTSGDYLNSACHELDDDNEHSVWHEPERHNIHL